jgi:hypothetical protein
MEDGRGRSFSTRGEMINAFCMLFGEPEVLYAYVIDSWKVQLLLDYL